MPSLTLFVSHLLSSPFFAGPAAASPLPLFVVLVFATAAILSLTTARALSSTVLPVLPVFAMLSVVPRLPVIVPVISVVPWFPA